jgi:oxalate decarboxylase
MSMISRRSVIAASALSATVAQEAFAQTQPPSQQPIAGKRGASDLGPRDPLRDSENPDVLTPPVTDKGKVPNLKWSFADSHNRLSDGGWARETTVREMPISTAMAGVNMRLDAGAVRELHWHKDAEWAYVLEGKCRITTVDQEGRNFIADLGKGDLWYFASGMPHSIQGLDPVGTEFLLVFPNGAFSEDSTFLITDWFMRTPKEVLAKDLGVPVEAFDGIPKQELYIFRAPLPPPLQQDAVPSPKGVVLSDLTFKMLDMEPTMRTKSGTVRIVDSRNFPISVEIAAALVEVEPGGMRELHWHPNSDEWQYYIEGQGRMTVFASGQNARTFDYRAGDVGYVPVSMGHYIENTGKTTLRLLECFKSNHYEDISLKQWMALTPHELVTAHLKLDETALSRLPKDKAPVTGLG